MTDRRKDSGCPRGIAMSPTGRPATVFGLPNVGDAGRAPASCQTALDIFVRCLVEFHG
jgi:hypothetical protein